MVKLYRAGEIVRVECADVLDVLEIARVCASTQDQPDPTPTVLPGTTEILTFLFIFSQITISIIQTGQSFIWLKHYLMYLKRFCLSI